MKHLFLLSMLPMMLFGAGCWGDTPAAQTPPIEQPITQPPVTPPLTPPEQPVSSTGPIDEAPPLAIPWNLYTNNAYKFAFQYPPTGVLRTEGTSLNNIVELILGETTKPIYKDQNVPDLSLRVVRVAKNDPKIKNCYYSEQDWTQGEYMGTLKHEQVGNQDFCVASEGDAAAGNRYSNYSYSILKDNAYIVFIFTVHSVNCQNYSDPVKQCMEFDEVRDTALIPEILKTYHGI